MPKTIRKRCFLCGRLVPEAEITYNFKGTIYANGVCDTCLQHIFQNQRAGKAALDKHLADKRPT